MKIIKPIVWIVIVFIGCNQSSQKIESNDKNSKDSSELVLKDTIKDSSPDFFKIDNEISKIDETIILCKVVDSFFQPIMGIRDSLLTHLYLLGNKPIKLAYTVFDDAGNSDGLAFYYFDKNGYVFANKLFLDNQEIIELYQDSHKLIKYIKDDGKFQIQKIDTLISSYRIAISVKICEDLMQLYPNINFITAKPQENTFPIIITKIQIGLYEDPSIKSILIDNLKSKSPLIYLGSNRKREILNGKSWIWYKVKTLDNRIGWVFGHPEFIEDYDAESEE